MKLIYVIVAENAFTDSEGRLTIMQVFDSIKARGFPAIHPKFSIVTKWGFKERADKTKTHQQRIVIKRKGSSEITAEMPNRELRAKEGKDKYLQYIANFIGIKFDQPGTYEIVIYMDGKKINHSTSIEVS